MERANPDDVALVAETLFGAAELQAQFGQIVTAPVLEFDALEIVPDTFVRIEKD